uniref:Putative dnaj molecular chaperone similarity domain protein n=1 Tax=Ornithodoros turicata TaxID=34597 RepID=A0A2R5L6L2_9ACAR
MEDHYTVLGVSHDATNEEIKRSYREKVMRCHPDKRGGSGEEFARLDHAWKVVSDVDQRKAYDAEKKQTVVSHPVNEEVKLRDMDVDSDGHFVRECRCGGHYTVSHTPENEIYVGCDSCSYVILVSR